MQNLLRNNAENNMSNDLEWQVFTETRKSVIAGTFEMPGVKRADGFSVIYEEANRENITTFLFKGTFGEFRFVATRWDRIKNIPVDTYIVYLRKFQRHIPGDKKTNQELIKRYCWDIESALLSYPILHDENNLPVKEVLFDINDYNETHKLVHAGEF